MEKLDKVSRGIMTKCLQLQKQECCLIITDDNRRHFGRKLFETTEKMGSIPIYMEIVSPRRYGFELPRALIEALRHADAAIIVTEYPLSHKQTRTANPKSRILTISTPVADTIERLISGSFEKIKERTQKLADIFTIGKRLAIKTPAGTDLTMSIASVKGKTNTGFAVVKGEFSSLPGGEAYLAPVSGTAQGKIVVDMSLDFVGNLKQPLTLQVKDGIITKISGNDEALTLRRLIKPYGQNARKLIGVGVGTNDKARAGLSVGEDKKTMGVVHITIGNNSIYDKSGRLPARIDGVLKKSTLSIDGMGIIDDGQVPIFNH